MEMPVRKNKHHVVTLTVNGAEQTELVKANTTLLDLLRETLDQTGTKKGCELGDCGTCTVLIDGKPVNSCLVLAVEADGAEVGTVEGLAADDRLDRLQAAFLEKGAVQCGFCIPGQLMAAHDLLGRNPRPTTADIQEGLAGNLCRCGCYEQITEAVHAAAEGQSR